MNSKAIYDAWAPDSGRWSPWAKPVLFAFTGSDRSVDQTPSDEFAPIATVQRSDIQIRTIPPADGATAIVIDVANALGVQWGLAVARAGYRPVPLYNSVPTPIVFGQPTIGADVMVNMTDLLAALRSGAAQLRDSGLPPGAPPAFLLDSRRRMGTPLPGAFDNRSVSLTSDFPSANLLQSYGIRQVIIAIEGNDEPQTDLAHTLRRWQEAGIKMLLLRVDHPAEPIAVIIRRPRWFRHLWNDLISRLGLRSNPLGGFGGYIPNPSSG